MKTIKPIRSFVRRERKLGKKKQLIVQELWNKYVIDSQLELSSTKHSTNIEIGFGMGEFLFQIASENPQEFFIGIEVHLPGVANLLQKLKEHPLNNLKIYHHDAIEILQKYIPNSCIDKIFLLFPDPWPKRKHHKRRIIQSDFIKLIRAKLKDKGYFYVATDIEDYANYINKITIINGLKPCSHLNIHPPTKFEQRGIKAGRKIWNLAFAN